MPMTLVANVLPAAGYQGALRFDLVDDLLSKELNLVVNEI